MRKMKHFHYQKLLNSAVGIILLTVLFLFIGAYALDLMGFRDIRGIGAPVLTTVVAIIGMGLAPFLVIKDRFNDYGVNWPKGNIRNTLGLTLFSLVFLIIPILFFSQAPAFRLYYVFKNSSFSYFIIAGIFLPLLYYIAEEFLFRGFLFWGLWRKIGQDSFWVNSFIFALFHLGKPFPEPIFAFFASLVFCWLSLKTKSFLPAAIIHFLLALVLNILVTYVWPGVSTGRALIF